MKKQNQYLEKWYIGVVVLFVMAISAASWFQFAKLSGGQLIREHRIEDVGSNWSVYEEASLCTVDSLVTYLALGEIKSLQVVKGLGKWLFYSDVTEGDSIADFEGTNIYEKHEMDMIADAALSVQEEMEKRGVEFVIAVPPNKENVYAEYMPEQYVHADVSRTDILVDHMKEKGVNVVSPKSELLDNHLDKQEYYYYDTHWNQLGAYVGVKDTLQAWNISMPELKDRNIRSKALYGNYHYCGEDDLAQVVGLRFLFKDEIEYEVDGTIAVDWESFEKEQRNGEISYFHNEEAPNKAKVFLVGDSFRTSMVPALREQFTDVYVILRYGYTADMLDEVDPDYFIAEYVERYSYEMEGIDYLVKSGK